MGLLDEQRSRLQTLGQQHVLAFAGELAEDELDAFLHQIARSDIETALELHRKLVTGGGGPGIPPVEEIAPPPYISYPRNPGEWFAWLEAKRSGRAVLEKGHVACLMVAGGQGSRLGFDGPKGCFPVGPVSGRTLFQVQSEKVLAASVRYGRPVPFFIMVSRANGQAAREFFAENSYFGLAPEDVFFFEQDDLPAVDEDSRIALAGKGRLFTSPNGHGGCIKALRDSGALDVLEERGIRYVSYFQVDNPLVRAVDPFFVGFHAMNGAEMSLKGVRKRRPGEKVGNLVSHDGRLRVIEYSDLPDELAEMRDGEGELLIGMGSIAIHMFSVGFLQRLASQPGALPYHVAHKKIDCLDARGVERMPEEPNGYKFEMFIFDSLPHAGRAQLVETLREQEFSPVKNAEGVSSPATSRADMARVYGEWLKEAGLEAPEGGVVELSPLVAGDAQEMKEAVAGRTLEVKDGLVIDTGALGKEQRG